MNEVDLHKLLMPPHPGDVFHSSALCSCGSWQYDSVNQYNLYNNYRYILSDHTYHIRSEIAFKDQQALDRSREVIKEYGEHA